MTWATMSTTTTEHAEKPMMLDGKPIHVDAN
jgi:hypothetical protein